MDAEIAEQFQSLHTKIDRNCELEMQRHAAVMQKFHGDRGDNGIYGRVQSLEDWRNTIRIHVRAIWALMVTGFGALIGKNW